MSRSRPVCLHAHAARRGVKGLGGPTLDKSLPRRDADSSADALSPRAPKAFGLQCAHLMVGVVAVAGARHPSQAEQLSQTRVRASGDTDVASQGSSRTALHGTAQPLVRASWAVHANPRVSQAKQPLATLALDFLPSMELRQELSLFY